MALTKNQSNQSKPENYLNIGIGSACAGHRSTIPWPSCLSYVKLLESDENVGGFDPTGSERKY